MGDVWRIFSRKERKGRKEMKGGNGATIGSVVTLCPAFVLRRSRKTFRVADEVRNRK